MTFKLMIVCALWCSYLIRSIAKWITNEPREKLTTDSLFSKSITSPANRIKNELNRNQNQNRPFTCTFKCQKPKAEIHTQAQTYTQYKHLYWNKSIVSRAICVSIEAYTNEPPINSNPFYKWIFVAHDQNLSAEQ